MIRVTDTVVIMTIIWQCAFCNRQLKYEGRQLHYKIFRSFVRSFVRSFFCSDSQLGVCSDSQLGVCFDSQLQPHPSPPPHPKPRFQGANKKTANAPLYSSNDRSGHDDEFCSKIVKIGAILGYFWPLQSFVILYWWLVGS